jgi:hypothetical protein
MVPVIAKLALGAGAAALAALALSSKASAAPAAPGGVGLPSGSGPEGTGWGTPVSNTARAASGRTYSIWMWPERAGVGVYTVAQLAGSQLWISFTYEKNSNKSTPAKTNVMSAPGLTEAQRTEILQAFKTDWNLPG